MQVSKKFKWIFIIVLACIIMIIFGKCSKAEGAENWWSDHSAEETPLPFVPPQIADPTPLPTDNVLNNLARDYQRAFSAVDSQDTIISYKAYTITRLYGSSYLFQDVALSGGTRTSADMIWQPNVTDEVISLEELGEDNYRYMSEYLYKNQYTFNTYTHLRFIYFNTGSFGFSFLDRPQVQLDRNNIIQYSCSAENLTLVFNQNYTQFFSSIGLDDSILETFPCIANFRIQTNQGQYEFTDYRFTWAELKTGKTFDLNLNFMVEDEYISSVLLTVILDPHIETNEVITYLRQYYDAQQTPVADRIYGAYGIKGTAIKFARTVQQTEDKYKMKWYEKLVFPDPDWTAQYLSEFTGTLSQNNTASWAFALKNMIYNLATGQHRDFVINIPPLAIMGNSFYAGGAFNFTAFSQQDSLHVLFYNLKMLTSMLITIVFCNSVITAVFGFFGIKLYDGVHADDLAEGDV